MIEFFALLKKKITCLKIPQNLFGLGIFENTLKTTFFLLLLCASARKNLLPNPSRFS